MSNLEQKKSENYKNAVYTLDPQAPTFKKGFCTISGHIEPGTFEGNTGAMCRHDLDVVQVTTHIGNHIIHFEIYML